MNSWHWDGESNDLPQPFCWVLSDRRHSCRLTTALQRMMPHTGIYNQVSFVSVMFSGVLSMQWAAERVSIINERQICFQMFDGENNKKKEEKLTEFRELQVFKWRPSDICSVFLLFSKPRLWQKAGGPSSFLWADSDGRVFSRLPQGIQTIPSFSWLPLLNSSGLHSLQKYGRFSRQLR